MAAQTHRESAAYRMLDAAFAGIAPDDIEDAAQRAEQLLEDIGWVGDLLYPLMISLAEEPFFEPPFRVSRDPLRIGAILFETPIVSIAASVLSADVLARLSPPDTVVMPGRLSVVRYVRSGGACLRTWQAEAIGDRFTAAAAARCMAVGVVALEDGMIVRLDGRKRGSLLENATRDVVTLTATIRIGSAPFMRAFAIDDGRLLRTATLDDGASRAQMLLAFLRLAGRTDAATCFDAATRDGAFFLRWAAMREWLALDARAALPRLRAMATDEHPDIRTAAAVTLAMIEARLAMPCPA